MDRPATHTSKKNVFAEIVAGRAPAYVVYQDEVSTAFLDHRPLLRGHTLLVPNAPYETLYDVPPALIGVLFQTAQFLAKAVQAALEADGSFLAVNTVVSQSVPHLHIHVVPRWKNDRLFSPKLVWRRHPYRDETEARAIQDAIRAVIDGLNRPSP